ncbi:hypothetical protein A6A19_04385 [Actinobacillus delphinicola]|uniref:DUF493 family protein YbeD n=1 Tax=Actinobacillus delphinicola TaxID=51161 RepID=UPI002442DC4C|nr:DUF493 family protein YbeD [Actinobacillus delphinicola]MDG6897252.1 hypothetical protein [Actinobacillus delphinicola]
MADKNITIKDGQIEEKKLKDLLEFPCNFTFKVVGTTRADLANDVVKVMEQHAKVIDTPKVQPSSKGNYESVSLTMRAENIEQVETLYKELAKIDGVRMVL